MRRVIEDEGGEIVVRKPTSAERAEAKRAKADAAWKAFQLVGEKMRASVAWERSFIAGQGTSIVRGAVPLQLLREASKLAGTSHVRVLFTSIGGDEIELDLDASKLRQLHAVARAFPDATCSLAFATGTRAWEYTRLEIRWQNARGGRGGLNLRTHYVKSEKRGKRTHQFTLAYLTLREVAAPSVAREAA